MTNAKQPSGNGKFILLVVLLILVGVIFLQSSVFQGFNKEYSVKSEKKSILPQASDWDESWANAYMEMNNGDYARAEDIVKEALSKANNKGFKDSRLAAGNDCLALIYKRQGKFEEAGPLFEKNLAIDEAALGKNNPGLMNSLKNVAQFKLSKKDYKRAVELYKRVVAMAEKQYGSESEKLAVEMRNLVRAYDLQEDYKNAREMAEKALEIDLKIYGPKDLTTAVDMNNLALIDFRLNLINEAFENAAKALSVAELFRDEPNSKVISLNCQYILESFEKPLLDGQTNKDSSFPGEAFEQAGALKRLNPQEAEKILQENLAQAQKSGSGTEQLGKYLVRLNNVLFAQGKDYAAIGYGEAARKLLMKQLGPETIPSLVNVQSYIAMSYDRAAFKALKEGDYRLFKKLADKSNQNFREAIRLSAEAPPGKISPQWTKTIESGLAMSESRMKEYEKAMAISGNEKKRSIN